MLVTRDKFITCTSVILGKIPTLWESVYWWHLKGKSRDFFFSPWSVRKGAHSYQHQLNPERDFSFPTQPYHLCSFCLKRHKLANQDGFLCTILLRVSNSRHYWNQCLKQPACDTNLASLGKQRLRREHAARLPLALSISCRNGRCFWSLSFLSMYSSCGVSKRAGLASTAAAATPPPDR